MAGNGTLRVSRRTPFDALRRELRVKYKGSAFGVLWSYLYPLFMMGVYTLVFSVLWRVVTIEHYPLFVLSGLAVWVFFQGSVQAGVTSLPGNAHIIKKVWFPREVIPMAVVLAQAVSVLALMFVVLIPINLIVAPAALGTVLLVATDAGSIRLPNARHRVAARDGERLLPRRRTPGRRPLPAVVLSHAHPL